MLANLGQGGNNNRVPSHAVNHLYLRSKIRILLILLTAIPKNNCFSNLERCNHIEKNNHAFDTDLMTCNPKVILVDAKTSEPLLFKSLVKASLFLGHKKSYLSKELKKGRSEIKGYEVFLKAN